MKFALVNRQREEAQPDLSGECPVCGSPTVAKCGEVRVWHWAHKGALLCDPWWESETEWHRHWKGQFPVDWQEIVHTAPNGERHIADVKTDGGWVIEFQHSYLNPEERRSRDSFYPKLIWVVDGRRRKTDRAQFLKALNEGVALPPAGIWRRVLSERCVLLREWAGSGAAILLDFGGDLLCWVCPQSTDGSACVAPYSRAEFIASHRGGAESARKFEKLVSDISKIPKLVALYDSHRRPSR